MLPSIPVSLSAELASDVAPPAGGPGRRTTLSTLLAHRSGRIGLTLTAVTLALAILAPLLATVDPFALAGAPLRPPSPAHPMGTDVLGRDLFSGILFGARTSLLVASTVVVLTAAIGVPLGMVAGLRGGWLDNLLMRTTEVFQVLPRFFVIVIAIALLGPGLDRLIATLALTSWPVLARVVRGEVIAMRDLEFVVAARASGATASRILRRQILPNVLPAAVVVVGLLFGQILLIEGALGFLGLGDPSALSWGTLAGQAQSVVRVAWWLPLFPGLAITVAVLGVNMLADALSATLAGRNP